jgi:hypothetical protein
MEQGKVGLMTGRMVLRGLSLDPKELAHVLAL